jgi:hypothetical protein
MHFLLTFSSRKRLQLTLWNNPQFFQKSLKFPETGSLWHYPKMLPPHDCYPFGIDETFTLNIEQMIVAHDAK